MHGKRCNKTNFPLTIPLKKPAAGQALVSKCNNPVCQSMGPLSATAIFPTTM